MQWQGWAGHSESRSSHFTAGCLHSQYSIHFQRKSIRNSKMAVHQGLGTGTNWGGSLRLWCALGIFSATSKDCQLTWRIRGHCKAFWIISLHCPLTCLILFLVGGIVALQHCITFCYSTKWLSYMYAYFSLSPHRGPPSHCLPSSTPSGHHRTLNWAPHAIH